MILSTTGEKKLVDQRLEEEAGQLADLRLEVSRLNTLLADREIEVKFFHRLSFFINYARRQRDPGEYLFIDYIFSLTKIFYRLYFFINCNCLLFHRLPFFIANPFSLSILLYHCPIHLLSLTILCHSLSFIISVSFTILFHWLSCTIFLP